jgi:hypothetical protein
MSQELNTATQLGKETQETLNEQIASFSTLLLSDKYQTSGVRIDVSKPEFPNGFEVGVFRPHDITYFRSVAEENGRTIEETAAYLFRNKVERFLTSQFDPIGVEAFADYKNADNGRDNKITFLVKINPEYLSREEFDLAIERFIFYTVDNQETYKQHPQNENLLRLTLNMPNGIRDYNQSMLNKKVTKLLWEKTEEVLSEEE